MKRYFTAAVVCILLVTLVPFAMGQQKNFAPKNEAVELTDDMTPPRLVEVAAGEYTPEATKKKIEGSVELSIVVDKTGKVSDVKLVKGLGYGLDENAVEAVKYWKYKPAEKDGAPVAVRMNVTVEFFLHG